MDYQTKSEQLTDYFRSKNFSAMGESGE